MAVDRRALAAGVICFIFWGSVAPLYFQLMNRHGIEPTELVMHRIVWSVPMSLLLVVLAGQQQHAREVFCNFRVLLWLTLSARRARQQGQGGEGPAQRQLLAATAAQCCPVRRDLLPSTALRAAQYGATCGCAARG